MSEASSTSAIAPYLPHMAIRYMSKWRRQIFSGVFLEADQQTVLMRSTSWADGLRGLATLGVVSYHLSLCFARSLILPCCADGSPQPKLFQLPVLRLVASGHSWVAVFFVLMGFVNALKPLKLARTDQLEDAIINLSRAALRRIFRLALPATLATIIAWLACQLRLMERGRNSDAWWLYTNTPASSPTPLDAIKDLVNAFGHTWLHNVGDNAYDQPQWTMLFLLQGSLMILLGLLVTLGLSPKWRITLLAIAAVSSITWTSLSGDPPVGFTVFAGVIVAEISLSSHPTSPLYRRLIPILSSTLISTGLFLMSHTGTAPHQALWSRTLQDLATTYFPQAATSEVHRTWGSIGSILLILGIISSPYARTILSVQPLTWLGKISFPVFLLHPLFMQTIMPLFAFGFTKQHFPVDPGSDHADQPSVVFERYPQRGNFMIWVSIIVSMSACLIAGHYWVLHVEPVFGRVTKWCEDRMCDKHLGQGRQKTLLPKSGVVVRNLGHGLDLDLDHDQDHDQDHKSAKESGVEIQPVAAVHRHSPSGILTPPHDRGISPSRIVAETEKMKRSV